MPARPAFPSLAVGQVHTCTIVCCSHNGLQPPLRILCECTYSHRGSGGTPTGAAADTIETMSRTKT